MQVYVITITMHGMVAHFF